MARCMGFLSGRFQHVAAIEDQDAKGAIDARTRTDVFSLRTATGQNLAAVPTPSPAQVGTRLIISWIQFARPAQIASGHDEHR